MTLETHRPSNQLNSDRTSTLNTAKMWVSSNSKCYIRDMVRSPQGLRSTKRAALPLGHHRRSKRKWMIRRTPRFPWEDNFGLKLSPTSRTLGLSKLETPYLNRGGGRPCVSPLSSFGSETICLQFRSHRLSGGDKATSPWMQDRPTRLQSCALTSSTRPSQWM